MWNMWWSVVLRYFWHEQYFTFIVYIRLTSDIMKSFLSFSLTFVMLLYSCYFGRQSSVIPIDYGPILLFICSSTMLCCSFVLHSLCIVLGILVKEENKEVRDGNSKVLVANHVSPCDHIAVHLMCGSITVSAVAHQSSVCVLLERLWWSQLCCTVCNLVSGTCTRVSCFCFLSWMITILVSRPKQNSWWGRITEIIVLGKNNCLLINLLKIKLGLL